MPTRKKARKRVKKKGASLALPTNAADSAHFNLLQADAAKRRWQNLLGYKKDRAHRASYVYTRTRYRDVGRNLAYRTRFRVIERERLDAAPPPPYPGPPPPQAPAPAPAPAPPPPPAPGGGPGPGPYPAPAPAAAAPQPPPAGPPPEPPPPRARSPPRPARPAMSDTTTQTGGRNRRRQRSPEETGWNGMGPGASAIPRSFARARDQDESGPSGEPPAPAVLPPAPGPVPEAVPLAAQYANSFEEDRWAYYERNIERARATAYLESLQQRLPVNPAPDPVPQVPLPVPPAAPEPERVPLPSLSSGDLSDEIEDMQNVLVERPRAPAMRRRAEEYPESDRLQQARRMQGEYGGPAYVQGVAALSNGPAERARRAEEGRRAARAALARQALDRIAGQIRMGAPLESNRARRFRGPGPEPEFPPPEPAPPPPPAPRRAPVVIDTPAERDARRADHVARMARFDDTIAGVRRAMAMHQQTIREFEARDREFERDERLRPASGRVRKPPPRPLRRS